MAEDPTRLPFQFSALSAQIEDIAIVLDGVTEAVVWSDNQGVLQWCNTAFEALVGYQRSNLVGQSIPLLLPLTLGGQPIPEDQHPIFLALVNDHKGCRLYELVQGQPQLADQVVQRVEIAWSTFLEIKTKEKLVVLTLRLVSDRPEFAAFPFDPVVEAFADAITNDFAEQGAALDQDAENNWLNPVHLTGRPQSDTIYRGIFENSPNGVYQSSPAGRFLRVNTALARIYGYDTVDELRECITDIGTQIYLDPRYRQNLLERIGQDGPLVGVEAQVKRKDGSTVWIRESSRVVCDAHGQVQYYEGTVEDITQQKQTETLLRHQVERERLLSNILLRIRHSLDLDEILQTTVDEVQAYLDTDRVLVFRFDANGEGYVPVESVREERLSIVNTKIHDPCFDNTYKALYIGGRISAISNIYEAEFEPCYVEFLESIHVIASLVVPIVQGDRFLGLLIAHHCTAPRSWLSGEIYLLQQLAIQVAIAVHQSELYGQLQTELVERAKAEQKLRQSEQRIRALCSVTASQLEFEACLDRMLALGREQFGLDIGTLAKIEGDRYEVIMSQQPGNVTTQGAVFSAKQTYCGEVFRTNQTIAIANASETAWGEHPCYRAFHVETYIGTVVVVKGKIYGTLCFYSQLPQPESFTPIDQELVQLMARWIGRELDRKLDLQELAETRDRALETTQTKSEFLAMMSHEIRTPMNAVVGMTSLLLDTPLTVEQRRFAHTIRSSSETLLTIINEILDFSKIDSGKLNLENSLFDLRHCVEDTCDLVAGLASEKSLELAYYIDPLTPTTIWGDMARLRQVLVNLANNAVKFTRQGEVIISITAQQLRQPFPTSNADFEQLNPSPLGLDIPEPLDQSISPRFTHQLLITVQDTGIGIAQSKMACLFQPFNQVDASTTRQYGGTGLGLAICHKLVALMGGRIRVQSEEGVGSTFQIVMPVKAEELPGIAPDSIAAAIAQSKSTLRHKQVLVIDDNAVHCDLLARQLTDFGMVIHTCTSGQDALDFLQEYMTPDLVLLDLNLPTMAELDVARAIHRLPMLANLPIVALIPMGYSLPQPQDQDTRIMTTLSKPIKIQQLLAVMLDAIAGQTSTILTADNRRTQNKSSAFDPSLGSTHPLRILVAEDNRINQQLQKQLLIRLGYKCKVVRNGVEVLEVIQAQPYDVVLMDIHMPDMDGLMATRQIRQLLPPNQQPWIIAVTASAMEEDRQRCLEAGMNDYISKPIRIESLVQALRQSYSLLTIHQNGESNSDGEGHEAPDVPEDKDKGASETETPMEAIAPIALPQPIDSNLPERLTTAVDGELSTQELSKPEGLDWVILEQAIELVNYDHGFIADLMEVFLTESQTLMDRTQQAIAVQNLDSAYRAVHTLKSSSASLGASRLADLCKQFEHQVKMVLDSDQSEASPTALPSMYAIVQQEYEKVCADIRHYRSLPQ